ncbi:PREDICTED: cadherin-86C isoform X2 [Drosophila arizonae]|uniref:Cadherin-86C isoform X2 n=1 Tax=Drosophila arizonae TaxID=7263 RepID=A0ABM1NM10_DROAR|nr:PREDICTED: cadherin-86C isoform X2 [Drosophila arizonae]
MLLVSSVWRSNVAEWMGRREAWSADKPSDTRTKPTRWEFRDGREQPENVEMHHASVNTDADVVRNAESQEYQQRRVRIKNSLTTKEDTHHSFHNSRTNLINDRDVYIEDVMDDQNLVQVKEEFSRNKQSRPLEHSRLKNYDSDTRQIDDDSMRRHEIDRGSDIDFNTAQNSLKNKRELFIKDGNVEILQLMTRDKTRDGTALDDDNIYVNVPVKSSANLSHPQLLMVDNTGKEILMRRFIEEQPDGKQIIREHYHIVPGATYIQSMPNEIQGSTLKGDTFPLGKSGPNSIVYSQTEPEVKVIHTQSVQGAEDISQLQPVAANQSLTQELEHSLKQQNALLRQILLEKEKLETRYTQHEIILETQSLPGQSMAIATQTDCDAGTQTEQTENFSAKKMVHSQAQVGSTRRRARSENDDSLSEDEYKYVRFSPPNSPEGVYWIKRHQPKRRLRLRGSLQPRKRIVMVEEVKRKIRTPIKEEEELHEKKRRMPPKKPLRETKTSILRKQLSDESRRSDVAKESNGKHKSEALSREVLMEISDSLDENGSPRSRRGEQYYDNFEGEVDENDTEYSVDSDDDEIVIRTNSNLSSYAYTRSVYTRASQDSRRHEPQTKNSSHQSRSVNISPSEPHETQPEARPRLSRRDSSRRSQNSRKQTSSEPPHHRISVSKYEMQRAENDKEPHHNSADIVGSKQSLNDRLYQSETELAGRDESTSRNVPKYMEWYYSKKKPSVSGRTSTESSKSQMSVKKKTSATEKRMTKMRMNSKVEDQANDDAARFKPEPAPRRSPPKGSRLLKEDRALNKQHKPKTETDTNHPLLQHSEHRFERENAPEVPPPPTKLPHYMYPETPPHAAPPDKDQHSQKHKPKPSPIKENEVKLTKSKINLYVEDPNTAHLPSHAQKQLNASTLEDDHDSGIAMNSLMNSMGRRNPIAEKKSVFSIAYDDVSRVKKIASGGESPQYS